MQAQENPTPLVTIRCITYNHEPFIRQCLEGFVMQQTNFPFEAVVHDDASTDGTAAIIREFAEKYPDIIRPIYETENQYSKHDGSLDRIMNAHMRGKYIAICEGDDYWIDPLKLQKQVDFMEEHPEYGLVYTRVKCFSQTKKSIISILGEERSSGEELIKKGNAIPTLSTVIRQDLFKQYFKDIHPELHNWKMGDYPLWIWLAFHTRLKFLPDITGVYRILESSASHSENIHTEIEFIKSISEIRHYFNKMFCSNSDKISKRIKEMYMLSLYEISVKHNKNIICCEKNTDDDKFISLKAFIAKISLKNKCIRQILKAYFNIKKHITV